MDQIPAKFSENLVLEPVRHEDVARELLSVIFKWKWLICGILVAVVLPVLIFSLYDVPTYRATARTIVRQDRVYLSISPGEESRALNFPVSRAVINSELRILKSREVSERAVKELGDLLVAPDSSADDIADASLALKDDLEITPVTDSNVIEISYTSANPERAVKIVNKVAEVYQERHAEINRPQGVYKFFDAQATAYLERLREAERRLKDFEQQEGVVSLGKEITDTMGLVDRLERELQQTSIQVGEEQTRLAVLKDEIKKQPARIATSEETIPNRTVEQLRARLFQLEQEKRSLLQLYTEKNQRVIGKQEEIDAVRSSLATEESYVDGRKASDLNPIHRVLEQELVIGQARLTSWTSKKNAITAQLELARNKLQRLDKGSSKYSELKKSLELSQHNYSLFNKRSEEARISEAMDREKLLNVAVLERAALPLEPVKGKKRVAVILAVVAGFALGIAGAFAIEFFNSSVRSEKVMEDQLQVPVLATIERFPA
jgi:polysaccharide biosynthesis protein PslE